MRIYESKRMLGAFWWRFFKSGLHSFSAALQEMNGQRSGAHPCYSQRDLSLVSTAGAVATIPEPC